MPPRFSGKAPLATKVTARDSFAGKVVFFQRKVGARWKTLQAVVLDVNSRARFTAKLPRGLSVVRAYISAAQAGKGYQPNSSHERRFTRR